MLTLKAMLNSLRIYPEMTATEKAIKEHKNLPINGVPSAKKYLGSEELRENFTLVFKCSVENEFSSEVFSNGFAIYDNTDRKTVINLHKYSVINYRSNVLDLDFLIELENLEWPTAVCLIGEERIWHNMEHPKSAGTVSEFGTFDDDLPLAKISNANFGDPESVYIKKEMNEKIHLLLNQYTAKNAEAYKLYYDYGYSIMEIGKMLGVSHQAISQRLFKAKQVIKSTFQLGIKS